MRMPDPHINDLCPSSALTLPPADRLILRDVSARICSRTMNYPVDPKGVLPHWIRVLAAFFAALSVGAGDRETL